MSKDYESLSNLLNILLINSKAHICIHDISGILGTPELRIDRDYKIHSKPFCDTAKLTARGYHLCMSCKMMANRKAVKEKQVFSGYCPYGLFEVGCPVEVYGEILAIVYVGNLVVSMTESKKRINAACRVTGAPKDVLNRQLLQAQSTQCPDDYRKMAQFIASYVKRLYVSSTEKFQRAPIHWAVEAAAEYINRNFEKNITLKEVAKLYFINEKYLGHIFQKQIGVSFSTYLNNTRLERAKKLLASTNDSVITVSVACGYQNVTYFNRIFKKHIGKTPMCYRAEIIGVKKL